MARPRKDANRITKDTIVSTAELAEILKLTTRRLNQLTAEGQIEKVGEGQYKLIHNIHKFIYEYIPNRETPFQEQLLDYDKEKALLTQAQRKKAQIELGLMEGEMLETDHVINRLSNIFAVFRGKILAIPARLAPEITGLEDLDDVQNRLKRELNDALRELSDLRPSHFKGKKQVVDSADT